MITNFKPKFGYIPMDNNVNKLIAFLPSLEKSWRENQRIETSEDFIETLDIVESLRDQGWYIWGAYEQRGPTTRKIGSQYIQLQHPDIKLSSKVKTEAVAMVNISNKFNSGVSVDMGMYRLVCSNGLISGERFGSFSLSHTSQDYNVLENRLKSMEESTQNIVNKFGKLKEKELNENESHRLAKEALKIRFGNTKKIDALQLLRAVREEDLGNDLWSVYNRIQENLTQSNHLVDINFNPISSKLNIEDDTKINTELLDLVYNYA